MASSFDVFDINFDEFDDVRISYADAQTAPRYFLASPTGFATAFGSAARKTKAGDFDGNGTNDTATATDDPDTVVGPPLGDIKVSIRLGDGTILPPLVLPIPFREPFDLIAGNFNGDANSTALPPGTGGLQAGDFPIMDLAIISGGEVFALISNGDGTFELNTLDEATEFVSINAVDVTGDGIDDLEATLADGSVTVYSGGLGGLEPAGQNFTGLPTPDSNDGKMLLLSGLGVDTVGATEWRFRLTVGPNDGAALDKLTVQIFDGDNGGLHQFEEETNLLKTCYRLSADPCGDGNLGNCNGGPIDPIHLVTVLSDTLGDDRWDTIFDGPHSPDASLLGDGQPPFTYEMRVFLSEDCSMLPQVGATISVATADAFKVRSNAMLSPPSSIVLPKAPVFESLRRRCKHPT